MTDFIEIVDDGHRITSPMPPDETIVEVKLRDGSTARAWYSQDIQEAGDWDFIPVKDGEPDIEGESMAAQIVAWRKC